MPLVALAGIALAAVLASTRVMEEVPDRAGAEVGFGYPVHFLYLTVEQHAYEDAKQSGTTRLTWSPWESPWRIDLARFLVSYVLVAAPLVGGYALLLRSRRAPPAESPVVAGARSAPG